MRMWSTISSEASLFRLFCSLIEITQDRIHSLRLWTTPLCSPWPFSAGDLLADRIHSLRLWTTPLCCLWPFSAGDLLADRIHSVRLWTTPLCSSWPSSAGDLLADCLTDRLTTIFLYTSVCVQSLRTSWLRGLFSRFTSLCSRMSFPWTFSSPPFHYMLRASGQSEVWSDARPEDKFHQYGWRCGTSEDGYGTRTLIGNWVEKQKDITQYRKARPLPSQFSHYFDSTYSSSFNREEKRPIYSLRKESKSFPGQQLELDLPQEGLHQSHTHPTPPRLGL
ncbi:UPF0686 protein C11orf1 homolog isoform X2 [Oncorhynchus masou masou]|uniref:UPF0686 protein C11orf1 homolog isoform X2 n=1 Tax=Oncorhynchus masou masou TaxID=90313 RepID=UPI003182EF40